MAPEQQSAEKLEMIRKPRVGKDEEHETRKADPVEYDGEADARDLMTASVEA